MSLELRLQPDPTRLTLGRFLDDVAERHGARLALRAPGRDITTQELRAEARALARALVGAGVGKGTRVGLYFANGVDFAVALFAVGLVGGVAVPVNTFAVESERDHILRHGDVTLLLMQRKLGNRDFVAELHASHPELENGTAGRLRLAALPQLRRVVVYGDASERELRSLGEDVPESLVDALSAEVEPSDDALLVYTSGTTALPKGVVHMHRAPVIQSWRFAEYLELDEDDRIFTVFPFFWTAGICMSLGASLAAGATLLLDPVFDAARALDTIARERATVLHAWPHQEKALAEHPSAGTHELGCLRKLEFDSPLAPIVGLEKDVWSMHSSYGLSETFTLSSAFPAGTPVEVRRGVHGKPLPGMVLRIVDPETGEPVARGESGEIAVKGVTFMRGYHKVDPESVVDENGFFRTQDGGSLDSEGRLHWTGRLSNLIKTGGANVSPLEIEARALEFPGLQIAAALGIPHPTLGEALVLAAVPAAGQHIDPEALRAFLKEKLAAYKVPRLVVPVAASEISYTGTSKVQVAPLVELVQERLAAQGAVIAGHRYESGGRV